MHTYILFCCQEINNDTANPGDSVGVNEDESSNTQTKIVEYLIHDQASQDLKQDKRTDGGGTFVGDILTSNMITSSISAPKDSTTDSVTEHPNVTSKASYDESKDKLSHETQMSDGWSL